MRRSKGVVDFLEFLTLHPQQSLISLSFDFFLLILAFIQRSWDTSLSIPSFAVNQPLAAWCPVHLLRVNCSSRSVFKCKRTPDFHAHNCWNKTLTSFCKAKQTNLPAKSAWNKTEREQQTEKRASTCGGTWEAKKSTHSLYACEGTVGRHIVRGASGKSSWEKWERRKKRTESTFWRCFKQFSDGCPHLVMLAADNAALLAPSQEIQGPQLQQCWKPPCFPRFQLRHFCQPQPTPRVIDWPSVDRTARRHGVYMLTPAAYAKQPSLFSLVQAATHTFILRQTVTSKQEISFPPHSLIFCVFGVTFLHYWIPRLSQFEICQAPSSFIGSSKSFENSALWGLPASWTLIKDYLPTHSTSHVVVVRKQMIFYNSSILTTDYWEKGFLWLGKWTTMWRLLGISSDNKLAILVFMYMYEHAVWEANYGSFNEWAVSNKTLKNEIIYCIYCTLSFFETEQ